MLRYTCRRILHIIPVLLGVSFLIFAMLYVTPGDPARQMLGIYASEESIQALRDELGLNDPFFVQYFKYIFDMLRGDFGISYVTRLPVAQELLSRFPTTFLFAFLSVILAVIIGVPLGVLSATKQYSFLDNFVTTLAMIGVSIPSFWMGLMLILLFALELGWLPASGFYGPQYWILPSLTIALAASASIIRMTRSSMLEVIRQDYIRTAQAKGQTEFKVVTRHALKNALIPILTTIGIQFGMCLCGQIVTEQVFSIPGLGKLMVDAVNQRNYPVIRGGVMLICISFCVVNLITDLLYAAVDPRIRLTYASESAQRKVRKAAKNLEKGGQVNGVS